MKEDAPRNRNRQEETNCPSCNQSLPLSFVREHILTCRQYVPTYINNVRRFTEQMTPNYIEFLVQEMDMIRNQLIKKVESNRGKGIYKERQIPNNHANHKEDIRNSHQISNNNKKEEVARHDTKSRQQKKQPPKVPAFEQTLALQDLYGPNDPFQDAPKQEQKIHCVDPSCKHPAGINDIQKFTYLEQCLHTMCLFCFKNYVRNNYVKSNGQLKCPDKKCKAKIEYIQIKQIMDSMVFDKLQNQLNSKAFNLIQCQKCHEQYQFQKGKPSDAPKKTQDGAAIGPAMAKHYAQNRFQCPKCKQEQCKNCKEVPYHLGFTCQDYQQHKSRKKCRYCRKVLQKGYMHDTGIHTFDDICDSKDCETLRKEACSKKLGCGHSCCGIIRQKTCLPCLQEDCAVKNEKLRGQNIDSYCSLCYIESLGESPCIQSSCGHIFHLKCLRKRIQLKWGSPRITFRFCQCPLCNDWLQIPDELPLAKDLKKFKALQQKIKQKALKRLKFQNEDKDSRLTDPKSPYYKNEVKYAMTIYAYFQCYQCGQPYFGGKKSCAQAMDDARQGQKFNPKDLVCPSCCPAQSTDCKRHGKEYISFKCRFCCSVAQWFCWGNTHFCDRCHKKQVSGQYVSRIPKDKLPKCEGKGKCPVGGDHGGNGDEFCLGCGICRGDKLGAVDF